MRPRYYCDHCNRGGGSAFHIKTHEAHCTKNPQRKCRMCKTVLGQSQPDLNTLMAVLPTLEQQQKTTEYGVDFLEIPQAAVEALREAAGNCPACMMAALRLRGLPVRTAMSFDFEAESKSHLSDYNEAQYREHRKAPAGLRFASRLGELRTSAAAQPAAVHAVQRLPRRSRERGRTDVRHGQD